MAVMHARALTQEDEYEWFKGFAEFRHLVLPHLLKSDRILIVGCGNSLMPMDLWREGFRDVTSVDLSQAVISRMASRAAAMVSQPALHAGCSLQIMIELHGLRNTSTLLSRASQGEREDMRFSQVYTCPKVSLAGQPSMLRHWSACKISHPRTPFWNDPTCVALHRCISLYSMPCLGSIHAKRAALQGAALTLHDVWHAGHG